MKTITEYGAGVIGEVLSRAKARETHVPWWSRLLTWLNNAGPRFQARLNERPVRHLRYRIGGRDYISPNRR